MMHGTNIVVLQSQLTNHFPLLPGRKHLEITARELKLSIPTHSLLPQDLIAGARQSLLYHIDRNAY